MYSDQRVLLPVSLTMGFLTGLFNQCHQISGMWEMGTEHSHSMQCVRAQSLSRVWLCDPMHLAHQAPLLMEFSRQEYWNGVPFLLQEIIPAQRWNLSFLGLLHWQVDSLPLVPPGKPISSMSLFFWAPKSLQMVTAAMKLKDTCSLEEKLWPI